MSVTALSLCCVGLASHGLAIEVEHVEDLVFRGLLVDAYVADAGQQGEVDVAVLVLLVVGHEFKKAFILFAVEYVHAVVFFDELDGLQHGVSGLVTLGVVQVVQAVDPATGQGSLWRGPPCGRG